MNMRKMLLISGLGVGIMAVLLLVMREGKSGPDMKEPVVVKGETPEAADAGEYTGPLASIYVNREHMTLPEPVMTFLDLGWEFKDDRAVILDRQEMVSADLVNGSMTLSVTLINTGTEPVDRRRATVVEVVQDTESLDPYFRLEGGVQMCTPLADVERVYGTPTYSARTDASGRTSYFYESSDGSWIQFHMQDRRGVQRIAVAGPQYISTDTSGRASYFYESSDGSWIQVHHA